MNRDPILEKHSYSKGEGQREIGLDFVRFLGAFCIIWIHAAESGYGQSLSVLCRWAVPFFAVSLTYFSWKAGVSTRSRSTGSYVLAKLLRLYLPFLAWNLAYLIVRLFKQQLIGVASPINLDYSAFLNGFALQMWFLPFALALSIFVYLLGRISSRHKSKIIGMLGLGCLIVLAFPHPLKIDFEGFPLSYFLMLSWANLPAVFAVMICFLCDFRIRGKWFIFFVGLLFLPINLRWGNTVFVSCLFGILVFWVAQDLKISKNSKYKLSRMFSTEMWQRIFRTSFGVYLVHVLFVEAFQVALNKFQVAVSLERDIFVLATSGVSSIGAVLLLNRYRSSRQYLLGSK